MQGMAGDTLVVACRVASLRSWEMLFYAGRSNAGDGADADAVAFSRGAGVREEGCVLCESSGVWFSSARLDQKRIADSSTCVEVSRS